MKLAKLLWISLCFAASCGDIPSDEVQIEAELGTGWPIGYGPVSDQQPEGVICTGMGIVGAGCQGSNCSSM